MFNGYESPCDCKGNEICECCRGSFDSTLSQKEMKVEDIIEEEKPKPEPRDLQVLIDGYLESQKNLAQIIVEIFIRLDKLEKGLKGIFN